jgi:hypothetical protein
VIGVEPEGSKRPAGCSDGAGGPTEVTVKSLAADSLGARNVGQLVHRRLPAGNVDHVALVPDEAITLAQKTLWQRLPHRIRARRRRSLRRHPVRRLCHHRRASASASCSVAAMSISAKLAEIAA